MADTIQLEIVTPDGLKLSETVSEFTAPSVYGEFGVLPGHQPLMAALQTGIVTYIKNGESHAVAVGSGFAEISNDRAVLLTDRFIKKADIDPVLVRQELKEADEALDRFPGDPNSAEYGVLASKELWAAAELELYGDPPPPRVRTRSELEFGTHESYEELAGETPEDSKDSSEPVH